MESKQRIIEYEIKELISRYALFYSNVHNIDKEWIYIYADKVRIL